jgi:catechol 2,3-dioxygenase-like lactoylglutathione lyase family enzyme
MGHPSIEQQIVFLYTQDIKETAHFYEEIIGFKLLLDQHGVHRIYKVSSNGFIGFSHRDVVLTQPRGVCFTIISNEVDEWYQYLKEKGVEFERPPKIDPKTNIYHLFFRDNNGYILEVQQFLDPNWANV